MDKKTTAITLYALGEEAGSQMLSVIKTYADIRLPSLKTAFLNVFREQLLAAGDQDDHPPLDVARGKYAIFLESITELENQLVRDFDQRQNEWHSFPIDSAAQEGVRALVNNFIGELGVALRYEALSYFTDNAEELSVKDKAWRQRRSKKTPRRSPFR
jgi:hypothetical protein